MKKTTKTYQILCTCCQGTKLMVDDTFNPNVTTTSTHKTCIVCGGIGTQNSYRNNRTNLNPRTMKVEEAYEKTKKNLEAYDNGDLLGGNPYSPIERYATAQQPGGGEEEVEYQLFDVGMRYWEKQEIKDRKEGKYGAVKWIQNNETGQVVIVTRGEYADQLKRFVDSLSTPPVAEGDKKEFVQNRCNSCGEPMNNDCPRCARLWES